VSIVRVGLAETKSFAQGYDLIFAKKKASKSSKKSGGKKKKKTAKRK